MIKRLIIFAALILVPVMTFANGGDQRIIENKYFINLSRAPFTPRVGVKTSFLASFVDIQKDKLIAEDLIVKVKIAKQSGAGGKRTFIFEQDNILVRGGVLELPHTFNDSGLHEMFFDFAFVSNPEKIYEVPDFLLDVQKPTESQNKNKYFLWGLLLGVIGGFLLGKLKIWKRK